MAENSIANNRSTLREFLSSLSTIRGDLSNFTAPPFVLDTKSTVELPQYWAEHLDSFVSPTQSSDPGERMLRVLKWWLSSLRGQQYAGRNPESGVKKPLNAVLGEVFVGWWEDDLRDGDTGNGANGAGQEQGRGTEAGRGKGIGKTHLVAEQVSHHPPITACRVWNDTLGVEAEGFTRQEITFSMTSGSVNIAQMGYALFKLRDIVTDTGEGEVYLIPLPDVKVKGILTGTPYPELGGKYRIPCTSGWGAEVEFSGKGFLGIGGGDSGKHGFDARVFRETDPGRDVWTITGNWDGEFEVKNEQKQVLEKIDIAAMKSAELQLVAESEMDPYETRQVWKGVREALNRGDMQATSDAKHVVEQGQRDMRKREEQEGKTWERLFFKTVGEDRVAEALKAKIGGVLDKEQTMGVWKFDAKAWELARRPWRHGLRPDNDTSTEQQSGSKRTNGTTNVANNNPSNSSSDSIHGHTSNGTTGDNHRISQNDSKVHPPIPAAQQQQAVEDTKLAGSVGDMSLKEQVAVEEYIRQKYSTGKKRKSM